MATGTYLREIPALHGWTEMVLVASVSRERWLGTPLANRPVAGVTTYKECSTLIDGAFSDKFKDYLFLQPSNLDARADYLTLNFGRVPTDNKPFRRVPRSEAKPWPLVLTGLEVVRNRKFPQATNIPNTDGDAQGLAFAHRLHLRMDGVPAQNVSTTVVKCEFLSPTQKGVPRWPRPVTGLIKIDFTGLDETINDCLHGDLTLHDERQVVASIYTAADGTVSPGTTGGKVPGAFYPRTNFTGWAPYVDHDTGWQQLPSGMWYRTYELLIPDRMPDPVRLK